MRKILVLALLSALPSFVFSQSAPEAPPDDTSNDLRAISSLYPRLEGSAGSTRALAYIESRLGAYGIPYSTFDFSQSDFEHSFSSCIRVDIVGSSRDTMIIAVPLDHMPDAAPGMDGAVNIALALGLLRQMKAAPPPVSVTVLFLGAEFGSTPDYPLGSNLFLSDFQPDYRVAVLYLNFRAVPSRVLVRGGGTGIVSPYWLMNRSVEALRQSKVPYLLRGYENQVFRLGLAGEPTIIEPYLRAGYPAISLEGEYGAVDPALIGERLSSFDTFFSDFLNADSGRIPEEWDRHYLLFQEGSASLIVTEKAYIGILLAAVTAILLYSLVLRKGLRKYIRTLLRNGWSILPVYAIPFLLLLIATFALEGILALRLFPSLWTYVPMTFLLLKLALPLGLYSAFFPLLRGVRFSRNGSFYSAASIFFLLADILVVAAINISFSFYFLWAFVFVLLATLSRNRWAKLLLFLPASFWGVRGLIEVFFMPALPFCHFILLSPIRGNLLIAGLILPFVLFIIRLGLLFRGPGILRRGTRSPLFAGVFSAASLALIVTLVLFSPFTADHPQPVSVTQTIDEASRTNAVEMDSPAPIGAIVVRDANGEERLEVRQSRRVLALPPRDVPISVAVRESEFLHKKNLLLDVSSGANPRSLSAKLSSPDEFILLDCSFPFIRESAHDYRLLIGAFPPDPLPIQLTLPSGMTFTLTLTMDFDAPLIGVDVLPVSAKAETHLHYVKSLELKT